MNLTDEAILKIQKGSPLLFEDICAVRSPKLGEIVDVGYSRFNGYIQVLMTEKPYMEDKDSDAAKVINELSTFQYFLVMCQMDKDVCKLAKEAFKFFTGEDVIFSVQPPQIVFGDVKEKRIMNEELFFEFRRLIKRICFVTTEDEVIFRDDDSPLVHNMKIERLRNRERVAKAKAKKAAMSGDDGLELSDLVASLPFGGCNLNMENIWNITYYSFRDQLKRMGWRETFDINQRAALAGAKIKKSQLKHWIKAISNDDKN